MRFALLLYLDPAAARATTADDAHAELEAYATITRELEAAGVFRGGEAFMPVAMAELVEVRDGTRRVAPVPASRLELSGFYVVECDEEQALDIAARLPVATHGAVEVRPIMTFPSVPAAAS